MILPSWGSLATEAETRIVFLFEDSELPIGSMYLAAAEARWGLSLPMDNVFYDPASEAPNWVLFRFIFSM